MEIDNNLQKKLINANTLWTQLEHVWKFEFSKLFVDKDKITLRPEEKNKFERNKFYKQGLIVANIQTSFGDIKIKTPYFGKIIEITKDEIVLEKCTHSVTFHGICIDCNALETKNSNYLSLSRDLQFSKEKADEIQEDILLRNKRLKKLTLLLDLDNTILHTLENKVNENDYEKFNTINTLKLKDKRSEIYVTFRPHLKQFFAQINEHFEIYIYTMGLESYAKPIIKYINKELNIELDESLLIARDSVNNKLQYKSIKKVFPSNYDLVLILDDRADVWEDQFQLLQIHEYEYENFDFDMFLEIGLLVLLFVKKLFYYLDEQHYKNISTGYLLHKAKKRIFNGLKFLLINIPEEDTTTLKNMIWILGGVIVENLEDDRDIALLGKTEENFVIEGEQLYYSYTFYCYKFYFLLDKEKFAFKKENENVLNLKDNNLILNIFDQELHKIKDYYSFDNLDADKIEKILLYYVKSNKKKTN